jgi:hypothetical protein
MPSTDKKLELKAKTSMAQTTSQATVYGKGLTLCHLTTCRGCPGQRYTKTHAYALVPKSFMKFVFSTVYRVTQKDFYAHPYTSMWAPVVARQISKRYSCSCQQAVHTGHQHSQYMTNNITVSAFK